jgi:hypothetical protein
MKLDISFMNLNNVSIDNGIILMQKRNLLLKLCNSILQLGNSIIAMKQWKDYEQDNL